MAELAGGGEEKRGKTLMHFKRTMSSGTCCVRACDKNRTTKI